MQKTVLNIKFWFIIGEIKMKKIIVSLVFLSVVVLSQELSIKDIKTLTDYNVGTFYYPNYLKDDINILVTNENYQGLWIYDTKNSSLHNVTEGLGTGYQPLILENKIIYRQDNYIDRVKYGQIKSYDIITKQDEILVNNSRFVSPALEFNNNKVFFIHDASVKSFDIIQNEVAISNTNNIYVGIENSDLVFFRNGSSTILNPLGSGNYIWHSLNNTKDRILFTLAGKGTYISDLNGNILFEIGYANAPKFSTDGKYVIYMKEKDNGTSITESAIAIFSLDLNREVLEYKDSNIIPLYPSFSNSGEKFIFCTNDGRIFEVTLQKN